MHELEHRFQCPYCWQSISMVLDPTGLQQEYIEDCEVCCRPIKVDYLLTVENLLKSFTAASIEQ